MPGHWLACVFLTAPLAAQHGIAAPPRPPASLGPAVHAPHPQLPPAVALAHVRAGNARRLAAIGKGEDVTHLAPEPRPAGAGRYVTAVLVCSDAGLDVPVLLGLRSRDVLLFSTPGGFASAEIAAALERAVADERLSLCLVLTHRQCASLLGQGSTAAAAVLARRAEASRELASRGRMPLEQAQALRQREQLLSVADGLRALAAEDKLRIVPASVDPETSTITWHTTRAEELPIAPVK